MRTSPSTGIKGLDEALCGLQKGDNVVWQADSIQDYRHFVEPYVAKAEAERRNLVYMRFAQHETLVKETGNVVIYELDATKGFEPFTTQVHNIISKEGLEAYYVFDCLSDLLSAWATDLMIGNFFAVTCPYLFELDTIAYFAIFRNRHSSKTVARIRETTQLLLDVYGFEDNFYVHPLKVWNRHSATMFLPHLQQKEEVTPIISSVDATKLFSHISEKGLDNTVRILDYWDRLFLEAEELLGKSPDASQVQESKQELCKIMIGREQRISDLAQKYFSLQDLINIKSRLIGSGFIGGKSAGMLIAQNILLSDKSFDWEQKLEPHDSFYVGSDVYYTYIVENAWWNTFMRQKTEDGYFSVAPELRENFLSGRFPRQIQERFQEIIEYFGQSPIIVRSSSLLEDSFGNAFAGKYESVFLVNRGDPEERYQLFEEAVRKVYASTMNEDALSYRLQRGLNQKDEQMALLIQRVSGSHRKEFFFPDIAGVGISYNTFVWQSHMDPQAGMIRLVFGLGTRAVDRVENDYPQIIALDDPLLRPYATREDKSRYSQHDIDLLDTSENCLRTIDLRSLLKEDLDLEMDILATPDYHTERRMKELGMKAERHWIITFEKLLSEGDFIDTMQRMLKTLESFYEYPVDIEFTGNFMEDGALRINLVQCRPLQTKGIRANVQLPGKIEPEQVFFESVGNTMGGSISQPIKRVICVDSENYVGLTLTQKYDIARLIGELNRQTPGKENVPTLLLGPGRWGTTTPSLGVPVSFAEINNMTILAEVAYEGGNLMPELSFGTHFFQDLVENDIFYIALFPQDENVMFNESWLSKMPNLLTRLVGDGGKYADTVKVYDTEKDNLQVVCDIISRKVICFST